MFLARELRMRNKRVIAMNENVTRLVIPSYHRSLDGV